ncbi:thioredoxin family protein [Sphingomonas lutea]|uniref:Thioredoxin family protein n=1 Tax=Sphingomonas lutea TaxID=1045317 RepID=A0A7G9SEZ5_9SPHN|nr:protein-disulfide reductase DsbD domain-containing protein [Sphingomonas lutea]QNN66420.1 thioredoxin family protein [Sphingomonas lutea]
MAVANRPILHLWLALLAALFVTTASHAQLPTPGKNAIASRLVAEDAVAVPGETITLALMMRPDKGWHGYWKNPGDSGIETQIDWTLPPGVTAGPIQYPVPHRLVIGGLMNYVYEGDYAQLIDVKVPADIAPGTKLPLRATVDYLACTKEVCVPETAKVALDLTVGPRPGPMANRAMFDGFRQALPKPLGSPAKFAMAGNRFRLAVPVPAGLAVDDPYFYPLTDGALAYAATQTFSRAGDMLIIETDAGAAGATLGAVEGVLKVGDGIGLSLNAVPGAVPPAGEPLTAASGASASVDSSAILFALLGALVGGLLLNIMPCVFPILSLKAISLAKAGGDERSAKREALAYTAGAVLICLALGAALLAIRAGGASAGWAFQLQDPRVILVLLLLITAVALNLAGLFELPALTGGGRLAAKGGTSGAFWTGALAAFVATPCTGPFMGAALGAALVLPTPAALAVFAGLGLGLALPFLLLGFVPALRRKLPKPGAWMNRFRRIMSVPMFLTALALAWILGRQAGVDAMSLGLAAAVLLALALWWVGRRQGRRGAWLPLAPAIAAAAAALFLLPVAAAQPATAASQSDALKSEPFTEARLAALQQEGRPVFAYFTADWCVTCKVNEKTAIERDQVIKAFADKNVAVLVGDWTRGDAAIGRFLEKHGRSGVPLYLYYRPGQPVEVLPQVLTTSQLVSLVS